MFAVDTHLVFIFWNSLECMAVQYINDTCTYKIRTDDSAREHVYDKAP